MSGDAFSTFSKTKLFHAHRRAKTKSHDAEKCRRILLCLTRFSFPNHPIHSFVYSIHGWNVLVVWVKSGNPIWIHLL